jgi:hypothetical protein
VEAGSIKREKLSGILVALLLIVSGISGCGISKSAEQNMGDSQSDVISETSKVVNGSGHEKGAQNSLDATTTQALNSKKDPMVAVYKLYTNARFYYQIEYADIFASQKESDNGDGIRLTNGSGTVKLAIWGENSMKYAESGTPRSLQEIAASLANGKVDTANACAYGEKTENDITTINIYYPLKAEECAFQFSFPANEYDYYKNTCDYMMKSFKFVNGAGEAN